MKWKKGIVIVLDVIIGIYLVLAVTAFNKPDEVASVCNDVRISIEKSDMEGFLTENDVRQMLMQHGIFPIGQDMSKVSARQIEEKLQASSLIEQAECYKTQAGHVCISIKQRIPVVRVMPNSGEDYYVDTHGEAMASPNYTCNVIIATGCVNKAYAQKRLAPLANTIMNDPFWKNQVLQLNVLNDGSVEMIPRVGEHVVYLGQPRGVDRKLERLRKFYRYGLSQAGWNKYSRISVEFDNQIICKRK